MSDDVEFRNERDERSLHGRDTLEALVRAASSSVRRPAFYHGEMGTVWVLDTETKGTGANMVPLERVLKKPSGPPERPSVARQPRQPKREVAKPREPRKFRILDVMTRQVPVDDVSAREAVEALRSFRSVVDVDVYVWQPTRERWRRLTFGELSELWKLRDAAAASDLTHGNS